jgi:hypothetical protein
MVSMEQINSFLTPKKLAIAGVSRDKKKFGYMVFKDLVEKGFDICPINPAAEEIDNIKCYKSVNEIPEEYKNLFIVTPVEKTMQIIEEAYKKGIKNIWVQQHSESRESLLFAKEKKMNVIYKRCIFMFAGPVTGGHKFHRFLVKLFGSYPKS